MSTVIEFGVVVRIEQPSSSPPGCRRRFSIDPIDRQTRKLPHRRLQSRRAASLSRSSNQATIVVAVLDANGKLVMEPVVETRASTILEFISGLRGELVITFEE
jgi:hypothetical protein